MKQYNKYVCTTLGEVKTAAQNLDMAKIVPLQMDDGGAIKPVNNYVGVYNVSKGQFCTAVIPQYNLIQHREYFVGFAEAMNKLGINYVMTMSQVGNRAFAEIDFPDNKIELKKLNEQFTSGISLVNSYDKSTGLFVAPRFTRLACTNGMILTEVEKTVSVKHHSKVVQEIQSFIEKRLNEIINRSDDLQTWVSASMKHSIEWKICCKILEKLFSQIKHREEILKRLGISVVVVTDKKTKKKSVTYVWDDAQKKKNKLSRWDVYNSVTNYLTHGEQISPHIEHLFHKQAQRILMTPFVKLPRAKGL